MTVTEEMVDVAARIAFPLNSMANPGNERIRAKVRDALTAAIALMRGQSEVAPSIECYSYDGDQWFDSPDDIEFVAGRRAGDRFTLMVSHYSINRDYVVTKAPDKFGDDYEVSVAPPAAKQERDDA